jgi:hypothetical protein
MRRDVFYSFFNLTAGLGWVVNSKPRPLCRREWPCTRCIRVRVELQSDLDKCEKLAPTVIRSMDCPALSETLYRLSYPRPLSCRTATCWRSPNKSGAGDDDMWSSFKELLEDKNDTGKRKMPKIQKKSHVSLHTWNQFVDCDLNREHETGSLFLTVPALNRK